MTTLQLTLAASGNLLQAFLFAFIGYMLARRLHRREGQVPGAAKAFVLWWYLMALQGMLVAVMDVGAAAGWFTGLMAYQTLYGLNILVASAQIWALGYYLIYLWTGRDRSPHLWLALFAFAYFLYFFVLVLVARPAGVTIGTWTTGLDLGLGATQMAFLSVLFFLPIFVLLGGYFLLAFEVKGERQRLRVIVLGVVAALWNVSQVDRFASDASEPAPFLGFIMVLNLAWIVVLYLVYVPPAWLQRRLAGPPELDAEPDPDEGGDAAGRPPMEHEPRGDLRPGGVQVRDDPSTEGGGPMRHG